MKQDGRVARMVHVLIHMGLLGGRETSETIAKMLNTNPVVVRRTMGALKAQGIVSSEGGRRGGWTLQRTLAELTILDIQRALDDGPRLAPGTSTDHPSCPVENATNAALRGAFAVAEGVLRAEFARLTLADLAKTAQAAHAAGASPAAAASGTV